jgi:hypothetical protein
MEQKRLICRHFENEVIDQWYRIDRSRRGLGRSTLIRDGRHHQRRPVSDLV